MTQDEIAALALAQALQKPTMEFWLLDVQQRKILFTDIHTIAEGRDLWTRIAAETTNLWGFEIMKSETIIYEGNYTTDEC